MAQDILVPTLPVEIFLRRETNTDPVLISGGATVWLSDQLEDFGKLKSSGDGVSPIVDVQCSISDKFSGDARNMSMFQLPVNDFIDSVIQAETDLKDGRVSDPTVKVYLCQCPILSNIKEIPEVLPHIKPFVKVPTCIESSALQRINLWISSISTQTGLHFDDKHNILCVARGSKTLTLYPPSETRFIGPRPVYDVSPHHSSFDPHNPDLKMFPESGRARKAVVTVKAGDALFLPEGWWHQVDSEPFTVAVNFWFDGLREKLLESSSPNGMEVYYGRIILRKLIESEKRRQVADSIAKSSATTQIPSFSGENEILEWMREILKDTDALNDVLRAMSFSEMSTILPVLAHTPTLESSEDSQSTSSHIAHSPANTIWREAVNLLSPLTAEVLTSKWQHVIDEETSCRSSDNLNGNAPSTEEFYRSVFPDGQEDLRDILLRKTERFSEIIAKEVMFKDFGINYTVEKKK
eukprot:882759_1